MSEQPHPERVRLLPWRIPPLAVDIVLVGLIVAGLIAQSLAEDSNAGSIELVAGAIAVIVILARRRFPIPALAIGVAVAAIVVAIADRPSLIMPATLVALYNVATRHDGRTAMIAGASTTVVFASVVVALLEQGEIDGAGLASIAWPAFATAAGTAVRSTRQNLAATQDRARRAEATREIEAQRRVTEERLRIARDVHDLVAHHIAVVNVQSGVAGHVLRSDPDAAEAALDTVRDAASTAVDQLGELLGVLRAPDDTDTDGPVDPTPDLEAIDDLISSFSTSGLVVEHQTSGAPRPLSPSAQIAAYRVVQEALTNAHKHGDGTAAVARRFDDDALEIVVVNRAQPEVASGNGAARGFGLVGMRERLEAVGGQLSIDRTGGRFTVRAVIPAQGAGMATSPSPTSGPGQQQ